MVVYTKAIDFQIAVRDALKNQHVKSIGYYKQNMLKTGVFKVKV